ncbi:3,4-dihydroxy-2-butanone-4-phosphate synthase [Bacteroides sp. 51]|uniref:3,4-dihydroxy-2-butanone-4-phosphate synthase n=1 Tax=Bacteroides sp. 51 TaxID=2302938 RepID=UPI0013D3037B|nr:3,4-dihydroxy-2-butanone-4-phosphate synthase [Bacteroides sp. 51]NDV83872.1 3,4-dihydroxy-2-butanone-4-phosphate synthase [Bacteroides sp. 51]
MEVTLNTIEEGLEELRQGRILIVVDDEDRENEGDFIVAGEKITAEIVNFMLTYGRGVMCVPLTESRCKELQLEMMACDNTSLLGTPFTMSVDLVGYGCTTGVSTHDRTATIKALMDPATKPEELARPGHIFPLKAASKGVLERNGHTEAVIDMTRLAGLQLGGALIEILNPDGSMARLPQLIEIAREHQLKICSIADLVQYRIQHNL